MSELHPHPKPERVKKNGHPFGCNCRPCIGSRNRRKGLKAQRIARKQAGVESHRWGDGGNEETWTRTGLGEHFQIEVKSGGQVPKKVTDAIAQAQGAKAIGDTRPAATMWVPAGSTRAIFVGYVDDLTTILAAQGPTQNGRIKMTARTIKRLADEIEEFCD